MRSVVPISVAGYLAAALFSLAPAAAPVENSGGLANSVNRHTSAVGAIAESGEFQCSLTASNQRGGEVATDATLDQLIVVKLADWRGEHASIRIHRRMLYPVLLKKNIPVALSVKTTESYLRFSGSSITAQNDSIVANFKNNAAPRIAQGKPTLQSPAPNYSGFKALVGRLTEDDENGGEFEVDVYVRIIVDWTYPTRRTSEVSLHRAAFVISQVPVSSVNWPAREMYYRFLPNHSPFRMLVCALNTGQVI